MPASYLSWNQGQTFLLPPSPDDWLPEGHLARFVVDVVERLDLTPIYAAIESNRAPQGRPTYPPPLMLALLMYAYMTGTTSSRQIERKTHEDIGFRFICGNLHPNFRTIAAFRRDHLAYLPDLFAQSVRLCMSAGLVDMDLVAIDGTKVLANASKRKAMSYRRMKQEEAKLRKRIEELLAEAERVDAAEDAAMGDAGAIPQVREELRSAQARRDFIAEQMRIMEEEARGARAERLRSLAEGLEERAKAVETQDPVEAKRKRTKAKKNRKKADDLDDEPPPPPAPTDLPSSKPTVTPDGAPKPGVQRNFTDPDSRIMVSDGSFVQAFNAQAAVDGKMQVVVAQGVGNAVADTHYFHPMVRRVEQTTGRLPSELAADAGYWAERNASLPGAPDVDVYVATDRMRHGPAPPAQPGLSAEAGARERMEHKVLSEEGRKRMIRRRTTVEPVFGNIKEPRRFRRFSMRGLERARIEWAFVTTCHNLLKLHVHGPAAAAV